MLFFEYWDFLGSSGQQLFLSNKFQGVESFLVSFFGEHHALVMFEEFPLRARFKGQKRNQASKPAKTKAHDLSCQTTLKEGCQSVSFVDARLCNVWHVHVSLRHQLV